MAFYNPITIKLKDIPIIVYPENGIEKLIESSNSNSIKDYLEKLYGSNAQYLATGQFHIVILWSDGKNKMSDIWIYDGINTWPGNPLVDVRNFRESEREVDKGVTAGDGLMLLAEEEKLRRATKSLEEYLQEQERLNTKDLLVGKDFYDA